MGTKWSHQLAGRFSLILPPDVEAWYDSEIWKEESCTAFGAGASPAKDPGDVWGGQMLPDTLPILNNSGGDYLCLRFRPDGTVSEIVRWLHEGSLWTPYGDTLTEALLFDAALSLAKKTGCVAAQNRTELPVFADWAFKSKGIQPQKRAPLEKGLSLQILLDAGLAEVAVRLELCKKCSTSGLLRYCQKVGCGNLARQLGVDWLTFSKWLHDTRLIPDAFTKQLARATGISPVELLTQDWVGAKEHAEAVIKLRKDLVWPFAVSGWASERKGLIGDAIRDYYTGLRALATTADFTEVWGITDTGRQKFLLRRLKSVEHSLPPEIAQDGYVRCALDAPSGAAEARATRSYWLQEGERAEREGLYDRAYQYYFAAGWDHYGFDDMDMILDNLVRTAKLAGWTALSKIADLHRQSISRK